MFLPPNQAIERSQVRLAITKTHQAFYEAVACSDVPWIAHILDILIFERSSSKMKFSQFVKNLHREESGQDLLEYALVLAAVLAAVVAGSTNLATDINTALNTISSRIQSVAAG